MSAYLIVQANIKDKALHEKFVDILLPIYSSFNAKILAADSNTELLEGERQYQRTVIVEFESKEKLIAWYQSIEFQEIKELRSEAADITMTYVHAVDHL